jgi:hypothetical protein
MAFCYGGVYLKGLAIDAGGRYGMISTSIKRALFDAWKACCYIFIMDVRMSNMLTLLGRYVNITQYQTHFTLLKLADTKAPSMRPNTPANSTTRMADSCHLVIIMRVTRNVVHNMTMEIVRPA